MEGSKQATVITAVEPNPESLKPAGSGPAKRMFKKIRKSLSRRSRSSVEEELTLPVDESAGSDTKKGKIKRMVQKRVGSWGRRLSLGRESSFTHENLNDGVESGPSVDEAKVDSLVKGEPAPDKIEDSDVPAIQQAASVQPIPDPVVDSADVASADEPMKEAKPKVKEDKDAGKVASETGGNKRMSVSDESVADDSADGGSGSGSGSGDETDDSTAFAPVPGAEKVVSAAETEEVFQDAVKFQSRSLDLAAVEAAEETYTRPRSLDAHSKQVEKIQEEPKRAATGRRLSIVGVAAGVAVLALKIATRA